MHLILIDHAFELGKKKERERERERVGIGRATVMEGGQNMLN